MIMRMPSYCKNFKCIADKCEDNCCVGWEVDIDQNTARYYKSLKGDFAKRLKNSINEGEPSFFKMCNNRCAFLNEKNLCDIIINLGEKALCDICRDHPRYFQWFSNLKEGGVGLCCEEGARLILTNEGSFSTYEIECDDEGDDDYDQELYECLSFSRDEIIKILDNEQLSLSSRLLSVMSFAHCLQENVDNYNYEKFSAQILEGKLSINIERLIEQFKGFEIMDEKWKDYIQRLSMRAGEIEKLISNPGAYNKKIERYLKNIAVYFIWRYFMAGVFSEEILSRVWLSVASVTFIEAMFCLSYLESGNISEKTLSVLAKNYSKEVEYSSENLDKLSDIIYSIDFWG